PSVSPASLPTTSQRTRTTPVPGTSDTHALATTTGTTLDEISNYTTSGTTASIRTTSKKTKTTAAVTSPSVG
ncbi:unnamed protein product, partial [Didymodactylos carnosus]